MDATTSSGNIRGGRHVPSQKPARRGGGAVELVRTIMLSSRGRNSEDVVAVVHRAFRSSPAGWAASPPLATSSPMLAGAPAD